MPAERLPWFRAWNDWPNQPNVRLLSDSEYRTWSELWFMASGLRQRWHFASPEEAAAMVRRPTKDVRKLIAVGLFDQAPDGSIEPHGWRVSQNVDPYRRGNQEPLTPPHNGSERLPDRLPEHLPQRLRDRPPKKIRGLEDKDDETLDDERSEESGDASRSPETPRRFVLQSRTKQHSVAGARENSRNGVENVKTTTVNGQKTNEKPVNPRGVSADVKRQVAERYVAGEKVADLAIEFQRSEVTIYTWINSYRSTLTSLPSAPLPDNDTGDLDDLPF